MDIKTLVTEAYGNSEAHGFWKPTDGPEVIPEKIALIHSEVSEALEDYRRTGAECVKPENALVYSPARPKPVGIASELADVVIRVADLCGRFNIDLDEAVRIKMEYNRTRPFKHGKTC